ncbi:hypothetical protein [Blattabacterium cuenoti]|uniref:hypothetical protein n=1 Tax=Blattabacterium cuenoti TaxID=1653831 RepID=UPI00293C127B|nr:hypothetical protein [Blattabacterium cuenoti]
MYPIMEEISSFIPYGFTFIFFMICLNSLGIVPSIFYWMNPNLYNPKSLDYDPLIAKKKLFLNIPFFIIRNLIYMLGYSFFEFLFKKYSNNLNIKKTIKNYNALYKKSVIFLIFFLISSTFISWDWIMSINPYWMSSLFGWYVLSGMLTNGIGMITIISLFLKKKGCFSFFNKNHLHDLSKYLFSSSLLWSYFWFCQFLLYWYGNIPEEISYFIRRESLYHSIHFWILIPNFLIPFLLLMNTKNKTNPSIVFIVSIIILIGHYADTYNMIYPDIHNLSEKFGICEISVLLIVGGIFLYTLLNNINKKNLQHTGNPFFQESKHYKNPHI